MRVYCRDLFVLHKNYFWAFRRCSIGSFAAVAVLRPEAKCVAHKMWLYVAQIVEIVLLFILLAASCIIKIIIGKTNLFHYNLRLIGYFWQFSWFIMQTSRLMAAISILLHPESIGKLQKQKKRAKQIIQTINYKLLFSPYIAYCR